MSNYSFEIKQAVTMRQVCEMYGVEVNRAGFCLCPFHHEKTPSCKVYKDSFYCFGCGAHGDSIDFVKKYDNVDFRGAVERLSSMFGIAVDCEKSTAKRVADSRATFMRHYELKQREREFHKLEKEFDNAVLMLRIAEKAVDITRPLNPEDEWTDEFCEAVKWCEKLQIRSDDALDAVFNFDPYCEKKLYKG